MVGTLLTHVLVFRTGLSVTTGLIGTLFMHKSRQRTCRPDWCLALQHRQRGWPVASWMHAGL